MISVLLEASTGIGKNNKRKHIIYAWLGIISSLASHFSMEIERLTQYMTLYIILMPNETQKTFCRVLCAEWLKWLSILLPTVSWQFTIHIIKIRNPGIVRVHLIDNLSPLN